MITITLKFSPVARDTVSAFKIFAYGACFFRVRTGQGKVRGFETGQGSQGISSENDKFLIFQSKFLKNSPAALTETLHLALLFKAILAKLFEKVACGAAF